MPSSEDTQWVELEGPTTMTLHPHNKGEASDFPEDNVRTQAEVQSEAGLSDQKDKSSSSTVSEQPVIDRRLASSFKIVRRRRDRLVGRRVDVFNQRTEYDSQRKAVSASTDRMINAAEALLSRYGLETSSVPEFKEFQEAVQKSKQLSKVMEAMELKLQEAAKILNLKESELYQREKKVYAKLAHITGLTRRTPILPQPVRSASSKSTTRTHPRARKYYDRAGEVKILRERIHNLEVQHRQDLASRQMRRQFGHGLKISDRLFNDRFNAKLASLLEELENAKKDAFLFKLACQRLGIALEDDTGSQNNQNIVNTSLDKQSRRSKRSSRRSLGSQQNGLRTLLPGDLLSDFIDPATKVRLWLNAMPEHAQVMEFWISDPAGHDENDIISDKASISSDPLILPPAKTDVPVPVNLRLNADFLAEESKRASTLGELNISDGRVASELLGGPPTSLDDESSQADFGGDAPTRRYSDPGLTYPFLLRSESLEMVTYTSKRHRNRSSRPCMSEQNYGQR